MKTFHDIMAELRASSLDERDKGAKFEALTKKWLELAPEYSTLYDNVWLYPDWAAEQGIDKNDVGIDLVARNSQDQSFVAIQCKFYSEAQVIEKKHIDSFFTALSKKHFASGVIVSTSKKWSKLADEALRELSKPVFKIGVHQFEASGVDWSNFSLRDSAGLKLAPQKKLRPHQEKALQAAVANFEGNDRGKLIMACGSGKTYTSLKIAEKLVPKGGKVLFLVPSIALLSQSLTEWKAESTSPINAYAVCSDSRIGKSKEYEDISYTDLAYPATTNAIKLVKNFQLDDEGITVVFSTYQSIDVIAEAQRSGLPEFDLIICDEAHRTTGIKISNVDESAFVRIHDQTQVRGRKRMYMTATPRIYGEQVKQKAQDADALLASMDDESIYGPEFYLLTFGQAVAEDLLSDYKVLVLAVSEEHVSRKLQGLLARDGELDIDDVTKIVGCYNGLRKLSTNADDFTVDPNPMRTAIAFSRSIKESKQLADQFQIVTEALADEERDKSALRTEADHVDGTFNMEQRLDLLDWLKGSQTENTVRILSNARCLSEGIDVPALDAVLFMNPRDSQVDVVQSIGRVMRKADGKKYGYVILPVVVKAGVSAEEALSDSKSYRTVWQVLQALRAHDSRFDAVVNKLELTGDPGPISVIGVGFDENSDGEKESASLEKYELQPLFTFDELHDAIFAKLVQKVGQRTYWETWAKDVADIAKHNIARITKLVGGPDEGLNVEFTKFVQALRENLNPYVTNEEAIQMLAQHLITKPIFDALFEGHSFTAKNPVSQVMQRMLDALERANLLDDTKQLEEFYESVRFRASGIQDAGAKQKVVKELYEKFFKIAFPGDSSRLGIVYTPNEIVDFLIKSADDVLKNNFNSSLSAQGVHILDPFTGTGTFIVRLLQLGLIPEFDLLRKFTQELHANEIVLLAYYVAAINIEAAFHSLKPGNYVPFDGIVLTDTFQMFEADDKDELQGFEVFKENNHRVQAQKNQPIRVIVGNPPYSVGQTTANENNQNLKYPTLDKRIFDTYVAATSSQSVNKLYDSYVRAIRWATDRIGEQGVVSFVVNGGFLDGSTTAGLRKTLINEFSDVYVYDLRGNSRESHEEGRQEGGNVFDIRIGVAMLILVKRSDHSGDGRLWYHKSEDYLSKQAKLDALHEEQSLNGVNWTEIIPNEEGDWLNQRSVEFERFTLLGSKAKADVNAVRIFSNYSLGLATGRDAWVTDFSEKALRRNVPAMIDFYNSEVERYSATGNAPDVDGFINTDAKKISWNRNAKEDLAKGKKYSYKPGAVRTYAYRPFCKEFVYFEKQLNAMTYQLPKLFPPSGEKNLGICVLGAPFGVLMVEDVPDLNFFGFGGQFFPMFDYSKATPEDNSLFAEHSDAYAITDEALEMYRNSHGDKVTKEDIFYYVYGVLHSKDYVTKFSSDLQKTLPRIPDSINFFVFSEAGRKLSDLHLNYESLEPYPLTEVRGPDPATNRVEKMKFAKSSGSASKSEIVINSNLRLLDVPEEVFEYRLGVRTAIDWVLDRYQIKTDKDSGLIKDPNEYSADPDYIVNLVKRTVTLSLRTLEIQNSLPAL